MKRAHRVVVSMLVIGTSISLVLGLILLGSAAEGPIASALSSVGSAVGQLESRAMQRVRGAGRAGTMPWLATLRTDADSLRAPQVLLLGAYDQRLPGSLEGVLALERHLDTTLPLIHAYGAWGDRSDQRFPLRLVQAIRGLGSVPLLTWEPWLADFENRLHPHIPLRDERDRAGLAAIAAGTYDFYIDEWARSAARFGKPVLVRLAHEMNDPYRYPWGPHNNGTSDFIAAWRHVVERFRAAGASNVVWVWSPHVAYDGWDAFYPGDDVVDWVATGVLNYGTVAQWSQWWTFDEIFGRHYERLASFGKPVMIAELGSLAVGGERARWYADALQSLPARYPAVRAVVLFHVERDQTITYQALDWSLVDDSASAAAVRESLRTW